MGFGDRFISYIRLLYKGAESLLKVGGSLTTPFSAEKGIRQGCPLSGLLYSIAIEPLLNTLRNRLGTSGFHLPGTDKHCQVSAYADDVTIFVTTNLGFSIVDDAYKLKPLFPASIIKNLGACGSGLGPAEPTNPLISVGITRGFLSSEFT